MFISLLLIILVFFLRISPWFLLLLLFTWIPDVIMSVILLEYLSTWLATKQLANISITNKQKINKDFDLDQNDLKGLGESSKSYL